MSSNLKELLNESSSDSCSLVSGPAFQIYQDNAPDVQAHVDQDDITQLLTHDPVTFVSEELNYKNHNPPADANDPETEEEEQGENDDDEIVQNVDGSPKPKSQRNPALIFDYQQKIYFAKLLMEFKPYEKKVKSRTYQNIANKFNKKFSLSENNGLKPSSILKRSTAMIERVHQVAKEQRTRSTGNPDAPAEMDEADKLIEQYGAAKLKSDLKISNREEGKRDQKVLIDITNTMRAGRQDMSKFKPIPGADGVIAKVMNRNYENKVNKRRKTHQEMLEIKAKEIAHDESAQDDCLKTISTLSEILEAKYQQSLKKAEVDIEAEKQDKGKEIVEAEKSLKSSIDELNLTLNNFSTKLAAIMNAANQSAQTAQQDPSGQD